MFLFKGITLFFLSEETFKDYKPTKGGRKELIYVKDKKFVYDEHRLRGRTFNEKFEKESHLFYQNYQFDFVDLQSEIRILTVKCRMIRNLPYTNRKLDRLSVTYQVHNGRTQTNKTETGSITLQWLLQCFQNRRKFVWVEMWNRMIKMNILWNLYRNHLEVVKKMSPPPVYRLKPFPYQFVPTFDLGTVPKILEPKVRLFSLFDCFRRHFPEKVGVNFRVIITKESFKIVKSVKTSSGRPQTAKKSTGGVSKTKRRNMSRKSTGGGIFDCSYLFYKQ